MACKFIPHDYQQYAATKVIEQEAVGLLLDMGLGKTVITLSAVSELLHDYFDVGKLLVIAPLKVAEETWGAEIGKWEHTKHLRLSKILGKKKDRLEALEQEADIYVVNRENVVWLVDHYKKKWPFDMVVVDELSSFKSNQSKRFKALRKVRPLIKRIVGLTGTPTPNGLLDLWPQVYLLDQGERLGKTLTAYRDKYFLPDKRNQNVIFSYKPKPGAQEEIYERLSDLCVSMKAKDWINLPERIDRIHHAILKPEDMAKYEQLEEDYLLPVVPSDVVASSAAVLSNKLLQLANGAVYDEGGNVVVIHDEKLEALEQLVEASNGKPLLVFYSYKHDLSRIKERFPEAKTMDCPGVIREWNTGRIPMLLAHPASAGHGLNLQAGGNTVVWFGLTWSLELYQQANARLHRQGQKQRVMVYHICAKDTVDEVVLKVLKGKDATQEALLKALKARIKKLKEEYDDGERVPTEGETDV